MIILIQSSRTPLHLKEVVNLFWNIYNFLTHVTQTVLTKGNVSIVLFINSLINPRKENIIRFYCTCLGADRKCKMPAG